MFTLNPLKHNLFTLLPPSFPHRHTITERGGYIFSVTSIVVGLNPGRGTFQWEKGIVGSRKPVLNSPNAPHKAAATGL